MSASRQAGARQQARAAFAREWQRMGLRYGPFANVVSPALPLGRLLRLSLFQVSVGMAIALVVGTLNRVMIVELGLPARLVAVMVALPLIFAPLRALVGFRSDLHVSALGWRRIPFLWFGTMLQFGGLAIMPFALLALSGYGGGHAAATVGPIGAALAFLLIGAGIHTVQTVGLALATDIAPDEARPKVVTLLCLALLFGVLVSALLFGVLLAPFSVRRLIGVVQGAAVVTAVLNGIALWKQEGRGTLRPRALAERPRFAASLAALARATGGRRRLLAVGIGTASFSLQDVLLEPYGGQVLGLPVGATTALTALLAAGGLGGLAVAGLLLARGIDRHRLAAFGGLAGIVAFSCVMLAAPVRSATLFGIGTALIGLGAAMFEAGTLSGAMDGAGRDAGLALGTWGAVQAFSAGTAVATGGVLRDVVGGLAHRGAFGPALQMPATGYEAVYALEIILLFATLIVVGPLVRFGVRRGPGLTSMEAMPCKP